SKGKLSNMMTFTIFVKLVNVKAINRQFQERKALALRTVGCLRSQETNRDRHWQTLPGTVSGAQRGGCSCHG
ncbi:hypothetical protein, partial [Staphylococcus aureus]|uniref:hypothetical protein n=1 Tax=Staphylococcus aureus TaxID=1280 RepID=UPI0039BE33F7